MLITIDEGLQISVHCVGIVSSCGNILLTVNTICAVGYEQYHVSVGGGPGILKNQKGADP